MTTIADQVALAQQPVEYQTALIDRCAFTLKTDVRKANAWKRWQIYTEQHAPLVLESIVSTQTDAGVRAELAKFVDLTVNPGLDITRQTAVCWRQGARRSIEGATDDEAAAFHELVLESKIDTLALAWNEIAEFVGPMIVAPAVRKDKLRWDVLLSTYTDVEEDAEDKHGTPVAAAWTVRDTCEDPTEARVVLLDDQAWTTFHVRMATKPNGETLKTIEPDPDVPAIEHGLGYFPGVPLRFDSVIDGDWWGSPFLNQRLVDATVRLGTLNAVLAYTRKSQNKRLLSMVGDLGGLPDGQVMDPEIPVVADVPPNAGQAPTISVLDFDTDPGRFIKHAEWIYRNIANAYGGQIESDPQGITSRVAFSVEALTEIRNAQIPHARQFERELWANAVDMCHKFGHPLSGRLPTRQKVLDGFRVDFGKLSRKFADPKQEADYVDWMLSKGATDQIEILRAQGNTTLDDEQLKALAQRHLENQSWFNGVLAERNLSLVDGKVQNTPQTNGAMGPAVRDGKPLVIAGAMPGPQSSDGFAAMPMEGEAPEPAEEAPAPEGEPAPGEDVGDVQAQALNGAQIASFLELAQAFASGQLPFELGERFLPVAFPGVIRNEAAARRILEPLRGFVPRAAPTADAGADAPRNNDGGRSSDGRDGAAGDSGGAPRRPQASDQAAGRREEST